MQRTRGTRTHVEQQVRQLVSESFHTSNKLSNLCGNMCGNMWPVWKHYYVQICSFWYKTNMWSRNFHPRCPTTLNTISFGGAVGHLWLGAVAPDWSWFCLRTAHGSSTAGYRYAVIGAIANSTLNMKEKGAICCIMFKHMFVTTTDYISFHFLNSWTEAAGIILGVKLCRKRFVSGGLYGKAEGWAIMWMR